MNYERVVYGNENAVGACKSAVVVLMEINDQGQ